MRQKTGTELCGEWLVPAPTRSLCKWGTGKQAPLNVSDPTYPPATDNLVFDFV